MNINHFINNQTEVILSYFDEYGNEKSAVLENSESIIVDKKPKEIIKESFDRSGYSMEGAIRGAKQIIGNRHHSPFVYQLHQGIVIIPTFTKDRMGRVYLFESHIEHIEKESDGISKIHLYSGNTILVGMSEKVMIDKYRLAIFLLVKMLRRTRYPWLPMYYYTQHSPPPGFNQIEGSSNSTRLINV